MHSDFVLSRISDFFLISCNLDLKVQLLKLLNLSWPKNVVEDSCLLRRSRQRMLFLLLFEEEKTWKSFSEEIFMTENRFVLGFVCVLTS